MLNNVEYKYEQNGALELHKNLLYNFTKLLFVWVFFFIIINFFYIQLFMEY